MSDSTVIVFDAGFGDLRALDPAGDIAARLLAKYFECANRRSSVRSHQVGISLQRDSLSSTVWMDGPWKGVCRVGQSVLSIGTGVKWGVFLEVKPEMIEVLQEADCLAFAFGAAAVAFFSTSSAAYDMACEGRPYEEIVSLLASSLSGCKVHVSGERFVETVSMAIATKAEILEDGFLEVIVDSSKLSGSEG